MIKRFESPSIPQRLAMSGLWVLLLGWICNGLSAPAPVTTGSAILSWTAPLKFYDGSTLTAGTTFTYNIYQAPKGGTFVKVPTVSGLSALTQTVTGLTVGSTECFSVSAIATAPSRSASAESAVTNSVCVTIPPPTPPNALRTPVPVAPGQLKVMAVST